MAEITATLLITVGLSFYGGDYEGRTMASGQVFTESTGLWAAVPVEWIKAGYVDFGDKLYVEFQEGPTLTLPILDYGCHLHYPVWDGGGTRPMGADFPEYVRGLYGPLKTRSGKIAIWRIEEQQWASRLPLIAWDNRDCNGPLTIKREERSIRHENLVEGVR